VDETSKSYRTGLTLTQPLSTKLVGSLSVAYNYLLTTDTVTAADSFTQNQLQASASLNYTLSPRFSLSLSYTVTNFMTTQINSSYDRQQITVGGSYTFR
jgi:predicted porin